MLENKNNLNSHKIFVLQGPNFNLLKLYSFENLSLDNLNKHIRKEAKQYNYNTFIFQTNHEGRAVSMVQKYRKKIAGIILYPGPWAHSGHSILDLFNIIKIPTIVISQHGQDMLFKGMQNISGKNLKQATTEAFYIFNDKLLVE